jgi:hypothetical protein
MQFRLALRIGLGTQCNLLAANQCAAIPSVHPDSRIDLSLVETTECWIDECFDSGWFLMGCVALNHLSVAISFFRTHPSNRAMPG